jgi:hypothetical protein
MESRSKSARGIGASGWNESIVEESVIRAYDRLNGFESQLKDAKTAEERLILYRQIEIEKGFYARSKEKKRILEIVKGPLAKINRSSFIAEFFNVRSQAGIRDPGMHRHLFKEPEGRFKRSALAIQKSDINNIALKIMAHRCNDLEGDPHMEEDLMEEYCKAIEGDTVTEMFLDMLCKIFQASFTIMNESETVYSCYSSTPIVEMDKGVLREVKEVDEYTYFINNGMMFADLAVELDQEAGSAESIPDDREDDSEEEDEKKKEDEMERAKRQYRDPLLQLNQIYPEMDIKELAVMLDELGDVSKVIETLSFESVKEDPDGDGMGSRRYDDDEAVSKTLFGN